MAKPSDEDVRLQAEAALAAEEAEYMIDYIGLAGEEAYSTDYMSTTTSSALMEEASVAIATSDGSATYSTSGGDATASCASPRPRPRPTALPAGVVLDVGFAALSLILNTDDCPSELCITCRNGAPPEQVGIDAMLELMDNMLELPQFQNHGFTLACDLTSVSWPKPDVVFCVCHWGRQARRRDKIMASCLGWRIAVAPGVFFQVASVALASFFFMHPPVCRTWLVKDPHRVGEDSVEYEPEEDDEDDFCDPADGSPDGMPTERLSTVSDVEDAGAWLGSYGGAVPSRAPKRAPPGAAATEAFASSPRPFDSTPVTSCSRARSAEDVDTSGVVPVGAVGAVAGDGGFDQTHVTTVETSTTTEGMSSADLSSPIEQFGSLEFRPAPATNKRNDVSDLAAACDVGFLRLAQSVDENGRGDLRMSSRDTPHSSTGLAKALDFLDKFSKTPHGQKGFAITYDFRCTKVPSMTMVRAVADWGNEPSRKERWTRLNYASKIVVKSGLTYSFAKGMLSTYFYACPPVCKVFLLTDPNDSVENAYFFEPVLKKTTAVPDANSGARVEGADFEREVESEVETDAETDSEETVLRGSDPHCVVCAEPISEPRTVGGAVVEKAFRCPQCNQSFNVEQALKIHTKFTHDFVLAEDAGVAVDAVDTEASVPDRGGAADPAEPPLPRPQRPLPFRTGRGSKRYLPTRDYSAPMLAWEAGYPLAARLAVSGTLGKLTPATFATGLDDPYIKQSLKQLAVEAGVVR